ncbi:major tail protein [Clostridium kluyveri]|uniref:SbsA Ig-like domain-containing protein n=1 Tax=Clostridium kluyveri TaxID=1534 RepID=A0A1L5F8U6_CLOKL|nr:major tail protein [Clostridium kluyveri]APM39397.1 hypothetical protein BS101_11915 [Clostridium kluyveri]
MDKKYGEFVGVKDLHYAIITADTEEAYSADAPKYLAPAAEITNEPDLSNTPTYYDNKPADTYITEGATTVTITVSGVPIEDAAILLGKHYDASTGRMYDSGEPDPPDVALGFIFNKGKTDARHYWYLKGKFSGGNEEGATKSNDVDIRTYQMTFTAVTTTYQWLIDGVEKSLKRIIGETTDSAFNPAGWFTQVQTPDTTTAPSTLTISSVPDDNATSVAVDANVVLTFNNKIASYNVTMVKSDFTPVTTANSFDTAGKVLTINPSSNLDAASAYAVIATNIKDIYGQSLSNQVINFATA